MNIKKLFDMQKVLKDHIGYNEPDRLNKIILALLVELGECANEWRGFKFWSENQKPRTLALRHPAMMEEDKEYYNPLLEEYVDGLHFVLDLGLEFRFEEDFEPFLVPERDPLRMFEIVFTYISKISVDGDRYYKSYWYAELFSNFLMLGKSLGFTWEQIEQAYMDKNKINHERQASGY